MTTRLSRPGSVFLLAVVSLLLCRSGDAKAHPHLIGRWSSPTPPGGLMVYEFGPGVYGANGVWRGPLWFYMNNCLVATGNYELIMFSGVEGTLTFRETPTMAPGTVGLVNFVTRQMMHRNVIYRP